MQRQHFESITLIQRFEYNKKKLYTPNRDDITLDFAQKSIGCREKYFKHFNAIAHQMDDLPDFWWSMYF